MASLAPITHADLEARVRPIEVKFDAHLEHAADQDERLRQVEDTILAWRSQIKVVILLVTPASAWALIQIAKAVGVMPQ